MNDFFRINKSSKYEMKSGLNKYRYFLILRIFNKKRGLKKLNFFS